MANGLTTQTPYGLLDQLLGGWLPGGGSSPRFPGISPGTTGGSPSGVTGPGGIAITAQPESYTAYRAPKGYSIVTLPNGMKTAVLTKVAVALGLKKASSRGGGITAREVKAARRVQAFVMGMTTARKPKMQLKKGKR